MNAGRTALAGGGLIGLLAILAWCVYVNAARPDLQQATDFVNTSYVAGKLILKGDSAALYPTAGATTYIGSQFPLFAHKLLPQLRRASMPVWQYSPANAALFVPLAAMPVAVALGCWQAINFLAVAAACWLLASVIRCRWWMLFLSAFTFLPVLLTLKMGQQGLFFGILPVALSLALLARRRDWQSGFISGLLLLNPKYLLCALAIGCGMLWHHRWRQWCAGAVAAAVILIALVWAILPHGLGICWLRSMNLAELFLFDPRLANDPHLYVSLPAQICLRFGLSHSARLVLYGLLLSCTACCWLWVAKAVRAVEATVDGGSVSPVLLVLCALGPLFMPIVSPHLLIYDLSACFISYVILFSQFNASDDQASQRIVIACWLAIDCYMLGVARALPLEMNPTAFVLVLTFLHCLLVRRLVAAHHQSRTAVPVIEAK